MKIPCTFLERILEIPALRLEAFLGVLKAYNLSETSELLALLVYAHALKYTAPEVASLIVAKVMERHGDGLAAIAIINKSGLVSNGQTLWDLTTAKELDASKIQGIYEQHGLDLVEYVALLDEAFSDAEKKRVQRRNAGVPHEAAGPLASGAPEQSPVSLPGPESA